MCSSCENALYCSKNCQRQHWKMHKPNCQRVRQERKVVEVEQRSKPGSVVVEFYDDVYSSYYQQSIIRSGRGDVAVHKQSLYIRSRKHLRAHLEASQAALEFDNHYLIQGQSISHLNNLYNTNALNNHFDLSHLLEAKNI